MFNAIEFINAINNSERLYWWNGLTSLTFDH